jgi:membrane protease YdiL (CAAX protease family)
VLALAWMTVQERILPMPAEIKEAYQPLDQQLAGLPLLTALFFLGLVPAFCEELFFRGYVLSGLRGGLGKTVGVLLVAFAFGAAHYSVHRLVMTMALGVLLGLLVVQFGSIVPAMLAHMMHNTLILLMGRPDGLQPYLQRLGFGDVVPTLWLVAAAGVAIAGILVCLFVPRRTVLAAATVVAAG